MAIAFWSVTRQHSKQDSAIMRTFLSFFGLQLLTTFQQGLPKLRVSHGTSGSGSNVVTLFEQIELIKFLSVFSLSLPREILRTQIDCEISSGLLRCCAAAVIEIIDYEEPVPPEDEIPDSDDQVPVHGTCNACLI